MNSRGVLVSVLALPAAAIAVAAAGVPGDAGSERSVSRAQQQVYPTLRQVRALGGRQAASPVGVYPALTDPGRLAYPSASAVAATSRWVRGRRGRVAFAVADSRGAISGSAVARRYRAASLVKAMLLVAYLRKLDREGREPDLGERDRLASMIRISDNGSADAVYRDTGPRAVGEVATLARMRRFRISTDWAAATLTAADQARLFLALDRLLPARTRGFARGLLESVIAPHSWGIPAVARPRWHVFHKGGWRPDPDGEIVHQAALLERGGERIAIAVLSDRGPSEAYGHRTVIGATQRLLAAPPAPGGLSGK